VAAFDVENSSLDALIDTAMNDPEAFTGENREFRSINFADLHGAYQRFCKDQPVERSVIDHGQVIDMLIRSRFDCMVLDLRLTDTAGLAVPERSEMNPRQWIPGGSGFGCGLWLVLPPRLRVRCTVIAAGISPATTLVDSMTGNSNQKYPGTYHSLQVRPCQYPRPSCSRQT
jgi:hypothetical protein